jgi:thiamine biosynthesis lipoprotein
MRPAGVREELASTTWEALGSSVVLRVTDPAALAAARAAVESELAAIDAACSRFRDDSELSRVNSHAGRFTPVGPLLMEALEVALRAAELTDGDVDPTVGRALELAGYDRDWSLLEPAAANEPPTPAAQRTILARPAGGWRTIAVDRARSRVRVPAGVSLDLGATAKAWAADRCARAAAGACGAGALVSLGGDVATDGPAPAGGWSIRVTDDHRSEDPDAGQVICIHSGGLASSSTAVRRWSHDGETMHHIIDPGTRAPVRGSWRTVSVAAGDCTDANIASTAALVRAASAPAWLAGLGLPALLVAWDGELTTVGAWPPDGGS